MGWGGFALAFGMFMLSHSLPVRPPIKQRLVVWLGPRGFLIGYSALSVLVLAWLIVAARNAPYVVLWHWAPWQSLVPLFAMLFVCLILCLSLGRPNPLSFGGLENERFDPMEPGLVRVFRHPLLAALALWALSHLVPNGDLAHVIMFGFFGVFAIMGGGIIDRRKRSEMGQEWHAQLEEVARAPIATAVRSTMTGARIFAALSLWVGLLLLHPHVLGVSPLP